MVQGPSRSLCVCASLIPCVSSLPPPTSPLFSNDNLASPCLYHTQYARVLLHLHHDAARELGAKYPHRHRHRQAGRQVGRQAETDTRRSTHSHFARVLLDLQHDAARELGAIPPVTWAKVGQHQPAGERGSGEDREIGRWTGWGPFEREGWREDVEA